MGNFNQFLLLRILLAKCGYSWTLSVFTFPLKTLTIFLFPHSTSTPGEKPFSCPHCNRAFADRSNLRAHLQTHSDVKKYQCKNCSKTFSRMSLLHKHEESGCCVAHWVTQSMFTRTECISSLRPSDQEKSKGIFSCIYRPNNMYRHTHTH